MPTTNTIQQTLGLDSAAESVPNEQVEVEEDAVTINVERFDAWAKLRAKPSSRRAALRLPQHDIVSHGIFHGFQPEAMMPQSLYIPDTIHNARTNDE